VASPDVNYFQSWTFATVPASVGRARLRVGDFMSDLVPEQIVEVAKLLTSELVTNAVMHDGDSFTLSATVVSDGLRIEVADESPRMPVLRPFRTEVPGGRGIAIVDALASRWGVDPSARGKTVWFEIDLHEAI
jgi:anti-sigma regulatory factor (Ser/Thr protein kinase)